MLIQPKFAWHVLDSGEFCVESLVKQDCLYPVQAARLSGNKSLSTPAGHDSHCFATRVIATTLYRYLCRASRVKKSR